MSTCSVSKSNLIPQSILDSIEKSREGLYVSGLSSVEQRQVIKNLSNAILSKNIASTNEERFTAADLRKTMTATLSKQKAKNLKRIQSIEGNKLKERTQASLLESAKHANILIKAVEENLDVLISKAKEELLNINNVTVEAEATEEEDTLNNLGTATEIAKERTDWSDNFSIMYDAKKNAPGALKGFLSFLTRKTFQVSGGTKDVTNFYGAEEYLDFGEAYDDLHAILQDTYPDINIIISKLKEKATIAEREGNSSLAWLPGLIEKLEVENKTGTSEIIKLFVRDMTKHKIRMNFVYYIENRTETAYSSELRTVSDNSITAHTRLFASWKTAHTSSMMVDSASGRYKVEAIDTLRTLIADSRKGPSKGRPGLEHRALSAYFRMMGMEVPDKFVHALVTGTAKVYGKRSYKNAAALLKALDRPISRLKETETLGIKVDSDLIGSTLNKGIAREAVKFSKRDTSNVMRVGDKLVHTYTANHLLSNKIRDLKEQGVSKHFDETSFMRSSLYGKLIQENNEEFIEAFGMSYVSLYPLAAKEGKRRIEEGATKLSDIDTEVMAVGFAFKDRHTENTYQNFKLSTGRVVTLQVQAGSYLAPTMSDKTRAMLFDGYTFRVAEERGKEEEGPDRIRSVITDDAIKLYMDSVIQSEVDRMVLCNDPDYVDSLNLSKKEFRGDIFYMTPYLNEIYVDSKTFTKVHSSAENAIPLNTLIQQGKYSDPNIGNKLKSIVFDAAKQDLESKADKRMQKWVDLGLVEKGRFTKFNTLTGELIDGNSGGSSMGGKAFAMDMALDMTFSEEMSNANYFQLVSGDPAASFKQPKETIENREDEIAASVAATKSNITKRLAADIAPGEAADITEDPEHIQIFLDDIISESKNMRSMIAILDGEAKAKEYEEILEKSKDIGADIKVFKQGLKSKPYFDIEATDAQEYITWQAHLKEMLRYGELTQEEYDTANSTLGGTNPEALDKSILKKVMGPRKPVYTASDVVATGVNTGYAIRRTYIKSSSIPLLPQFTLGTALNTLRETMEDIEKSEGKPVRAAYHTAVKQGFPRRGVSLTDNNHLFKDKLDVVLGENALVLQSTGLRIQNAVPYSDDKSKVLVGSQEKKSLFSGVLDADFEFEGHGISGRELKEKYDNLYEKLTIEGYKEFEQFLLKENGEVDNYRLAYLLKKELKARGETSIPMYAAIKIDKSTGEFILPLWQSDYADNFMSMLNASVKKFVLTKKFKGTSSVLASEEGIIAWEEGGEDLINAKGGVVYADGYDQKIGLQSQRPDPDNPGKMLPAQILLPFKERDSDGTIMDIEQFRDPVTKRIDVNKLPKEVRKAFSFRIPTQLQQSMAFVEIVGFLPESMGDVVIAPKDFTILMGSDFDVDKLYTYLYATELTEEGLRVVGEYPEEEKDRDVATIDEEINDLYADKQIVSGKVKSDINAAAREAIATFKRDNRYKLYKLSVNERKNLIGKTKKDAREKLFEDFSGLEAKEHTAILDAIAEKEEEKAVLVQRYKNSIQNKILDIHAAVLLQEGLQRKFLAPLSSGAYPVLAKELDKYIRSSESSLISHEYNTQKRMDGNAGMDGISIFSVDTIYQAFLEASVASDGTGIVIREEYTKADGSKGYTPIRVEFGNKYDVSEGKVGITTTLKKEGEKSSPAALLTALQNISVDNAALELMSKIHLNNNTANVYSLLHMLGFEEDIAALFASQPIIKEYVKRIANMKALHSELATGGRETVVFDLMKKYDKEYKEQDIVLADFKEEDAAAAMLMLIQDGPAYPEFGKIQAAILQKFLKLDGYMNDLAKGKKYINMDSKGFNKNMFVTAQMVDRVGMLASGPIKNLGRILGDVKWDKKKEGYTVVPQTLAGFDYHYGAKTIKSHFSHMFIEGKTGLMFSSVVSGVETSLGRPLGEKELYTLRNHYKFYLNSNLNIPNLDRVKTELFHNVEEGSFYRTARLLKESDFGKKNKFLTSIDIKGNVDNGNVTINYSRVAGDNFDTDAVYEAFVDLLTMKDPIPVKGGFINASEVAQQLAVYAILKGGRAGTSFSKFVPAEIIEALVGTIGRISPSDFIKQYFTNNTSLLPRIPKKKTTIDPSTGLLTLNGHPTTPLAVRVGKNLYIHTGTDNPVYEEVASTEKPDVSLYNYRPNGDKLDILGDTTNTAGQALLDSAEGLTLDNIYKHFAGSTGLNKESAVLKDALAIATSDVPVLIEDIEDPNVEGEYRIRDGKEVIILSSKFVMVADDSKLLNVIMHEHMHKMTERTLSAMAIDPALRTEAYARVQMTMGSMINDIINTEGKIDQDKFKRFKSFVYHQYQNYSITQLKELLALTEHIKAREIITSMLLNKKIDKDAFIEKAIERGDIVKEDEVIPQGMEDMHDIMHAASNIFEYMSIAPGDMSVFKDYLGESYKGFISSFMDFLFDVLSAFGISDPKVQKALSDIYSIASIGIENSYSDNADNVSVVRGGKRYYINGESFTSYDGETTVLTEDSGTFISYAKGFAAEYMRIYTLDKGQQLTPDKIESISRDKSSSLVDKLRALASAQVIDATSEVVERLKNTIGISAIKSSTVSTAEQATPTAAKPSVHKSKAAMKAALFGKNRSKRSLLSLKDVGKNIEKLCAGSGNSIKAEAGMKFSDKVSGKGWTVIKKLEGPTHADGGIKLTSKDGIPGVKLAGRKIKAKNGLLMHGEVQEKDLQFENNVAGSGWRLLEKLEGPTHAEGGIQLDYTDLGRNIQLDGKEIKAENGLLIEGEVEGSTLPDKTNPGYRKEYVAPELDGNGRYQTTREEVTGIQETPEVAAKTETYAPTTAGAVENVYKVYDYDSPNFAEGKTNSVEGVVFHHTGNGSVESVHNTFMNRDSKVSAQVVIGESGSRVNYAKPSQVAYHAGTSYWRDKEGANSRTIGIELFGNTNKKPLTEQQIESTIEYLGPIIKEYNLTADDFTTHAKVAYDKDKYAETGVREFSRKTDITQVEFDRMMKAITEKYYSSGPNEYAMGGDLDDVKDGGMLDEVAVYSTEDLDTAVNEANALFNTELKEYEKEKVAYDAGMATYNEKLKIYNDSQKDIENGRNYSSLLEYAGKSVDEYPFALSEEVLGAVKNNKGIITKEQIENEISNYGKRDYSAYKDGVAELQGKLENIMASGEYDEGAYADLRQSLPDNAPFIIEHSIEDLDNNEVDVLEEIERDTKNGYAPTGYLYGPEVGFSPLYDKPKELVAPVKPVNNKDKVAYDPAYKDMFMRSLWPDNTEKFPERKIGSLIKDDNRFEHGFTLAEAKKFPKAIRDKFNIDYTKKTK